VRSRFHPEKNASQIVFDTAKGEQTFKTMSLETIPNKPHRPITGRDSFVLGTDNISNAHHSPPSTETSDSSPLLDSEDSESQSPAGRRISNPGFQFKPPEGVPLAPFAREYSGDSPDAAPAKLPKQTRDIMRTDDIPGARPHQHTHEVSRETDGLNVKDINNDGIFKTTRTVDPLNPVYFYDGRELRDDETIGKSKQPMAGHRGPDRMLSLDDIEGAQADSTVKKYRNFRNRGTTEEEADILMIPSMWKQGLQMQVEQAKRNARGDRLRTYEGRGTHVGIGGAEVSEEEAPRIQRDTRGSSRHDTF
jgi:hypothetical protein